MKDRHEVWVVGGILVMLLLFGLAGGSDYQEELKTQQVYIDNVCDGVWPNYKELEIDCDE